MTRSKPGEAAHWSTAARWGRAHGYVLAVCPGCGQRQLAAVVDTLKADGSLKAGGAWPRCKLCAPMDRGPRVQPLDDPSRVRRLRPGEPRTKRQLAEDGCIVRPPGKPPATLPPKLPERAP